MALKPCPQCGKMISDKAETCPKCGLDIKNLYSAENSQGTQNINNPPINENAELNNISIQPPINEKPSHQGDPSFIKEHSSNEASSYTGQMKKSRTGLWIVLSIILAVGIGAAIWIPVHLHNEKLLTPEEEVRKFGSYFVEKISAGQLDSIKDFYPEISIADSIVQLKSDTIKVLEIAPGQYDVTLAEGVNLKINRSEEGKITVSESKGLFAYPADKMGIAKKTGMWEDNLTDAQLNERLKDEDFFKFIKKSKTVNDKKIISVGQVQPNDKNIESCGFCDGHLIITNQTDVFISGDDYELVNKVGYQGQATDYDDGYSEFGSHEKGKDLEPYGKARYEAEWGFRVYNNYRIKWKLTKEQLQEKFAPFTGNEYREYLDLKK